MRVFPVVAVLGVIGWSVLNPDGVFRSKRPTLAPKRSSAAVSQDFRWSGRIESGKAIEVRGINGDVRAMPASGTEVEVTAETREGRRGDPGDVTIDGVEHADGVAIGLSHFGASAPAGVLYEQFGLTAQRVADEAMRLIRGDVK